MHTWTTDDGDIILRLDTGDLVLESIRSAIDTHGLEMGAVISAIGTVSPLRIHVLNTTDLSSAPAERNDMYELDGCWEIGSIDGLIANGEPHLHIVASDGDRTVAGHLEDGNTINALGEVFIQRIKGPSLERTPNAYDVSTLEKRE